MKKAKLRLNKTILRRLSKREAEGVQAGMDEDPPPMILPDTNLWCNLTAAKCESGNWPCH